MPAPRPAAHGPIRADHPASSAELERTGRGPDHYLDRGGTDLHGPPSSPAQILDDWRGSKLATLPRRRREAAAELAAAGQRPTAARYSRETRDCQGGLTILGHRAAGGEAHAWAVPADDCCARADCVCPACVARATRDRVSRVRDRLAAVSDVADLPANLGHVVLTLPRDVRPPPTVLRSEMAEMRRWARRVVTAWIHAIHPELGEPYSRRNPGGWRVGGWDVAHPEGDKDPGEWKPHIHLTILGLAWKEGVWRELPMRVEPWHLDLLRWLWGGVLALWLGTECPADRVVVHYQYRLDRPDRAGQYDHRLRYDLRTWPDYHPAVTRLVYWGIMAPACVGRTHAIVIKRLAEQTDSAMDECPCCGAPADARTVLRHGDGLDPETPAWLLRARWVDRGMTETEARGPPGPGR